jgi:hypothetical protein
VQSVIQGLGKAQFRQLRGHRNGQLDNLLHTGARLARRVPNRNP